MACSPDKTKHNWHCLPAWIRHMEETGKWTKRIRLNMGFTSGLYTIDGKAAHFPPGPFSVRFPSQSQLAQSSYADPGQYVHQVSQATSSHPQTHGYPVSLAETGRATNPAVGACYTPAAKSALSPWEILCLGETSWWTIKTNHQFLLLYQLGRQTFPRKRTFLRHGQCCKEKGK